MYGLHVNRFLCFNPRSKDFSISKPMFQSMSRPATSQQKIVFPVATDDGGPPSVVQLTPRLLEKTIQSKMLLSLHKLELNLARCIGPGQIFHR